MLNRFYRAMLLLPLALLPLLSCKSDTGATQRYVRDVFVFNQKDSERVSVQLILDNRPDSSVNKVGLAHYTEHLVWLSIDGKSSFTDGQHSNAFTNPHVIGYWNSGTKDELEAIVGRLAKVFEPIEVADQFAEEERDIVLREYDFRVKGKPFRQAMVVANAYLYKNNIGGQAVLGEITDIAALKYTDAIAFHANTHKQENAVLAVVGDVNERDVQAALRKAGIPAISPELTLTQPENQFVVSQSASREFRIVDNANSRSVIVRRIVQLDERVNVHKLSLVSALLADTYNSRLVGGFGKRLYVDEFVVSEYSVSIFPLDEQHIEIVVTARPERQVPMETVVQNILSLLSNENEPVNSDTFERVKARNSPKWPDWADEGDTLEWMSRYGIHQLSNLRLPLPQAELESISAGLTHSDLIYLEQAIRRDGREAIIYIGEDVNE